MRRLLGSKARAVSSIMGVFPPIFVQSLKAGGIAWFATATTPLEALHCEEAGADAVIAQGFEAGGIVAPSMRMPPSGNAWG
jgi:nitronate monooxygenase